ncbi:hypothetical protein J3Q64DRAFT_1852038 [Phycomyces blakesleeanus]|uniref:Homeodomain-like DNA binding domain-containing transcription factor n=1 Tax=Phycomyces blakesleeanus TaxID=4837 RepID=A0ABR3AMU5_PHYBL
MKVERKKPGPGQVVARPTLTIQDGVEELTIKKTRIVVFMKNECNLRLKNITRHPAQQNSPKSIEARASWTAEWIANGIY